MLPGSSGPVRAKVLERESDPKFTSSVPREYALSPRTNRRPQQKIGEVCGPESQRPPVTATLIVLRPARRSSTRPPGILKTLLLILLSAGCGWIREIYYIGDSFMHQFFSVVGCQISWKELAFPIERKYT